MRRLRTRASHCWRWPRGRTAPLCVVEPWGETGSMGWARSGRSFYCWHLSRGEGRWGSRGQGSAGQCRGGCGHHREPRKKPGSPLGLGPIYQPGLVLVHSRKGTCTPVLFPRTSLGPLHCLFSLAAAPSPALQRDSFASFRSLLREASPTAAPPSLSLHPALCFFIALPPT